MRLFGLITLALVAMAAIAITPVFSQNMKEPVVAKTNDGMSEGIKVHGDWEVKVTDPKTGTEQLYAFRNEMTGAGFVLGRILVGGSLNSSSGNYQYKWDGWRIIALDPASGAKCESENIHPTPVLHPDSGGYLGYKTKLEFEAVCSIPADFYVIHDVATYANFEKVDSNNGGALGISHQFTRKELKDPIPVQVGQLIAFNVSISFE